MIEEIILGILVAQYVMRGAGMVAGKIMAPNRRKFTIAAAIFTFVFWPFVEGANSVATNYNSSVE